MSQVQEIKTEPSEHAQLNDNDLTPPRIDSVSSPRIYTSIEIGTTAGWESDAGEAATVIPKNEPDSSPDEKYFAEFIGQRTLPEDLKTEIKADSNEATERTDIDHLGNSFAKKEELDDMDLGNFTDTWLVDTEMESLEDRNLQILLDQRNELLKEHDQLLEQEETATSPSNKKRKKHKKDKRRHRRRSQDREEKEGNKNRSLNGKSSSPSMHGQSVHSNNKKRKERPRKEARDMESNRQTVGDEENRQPIRKSHSPSKNLEIYLNNNCEKEISREETNCMDLSLLTNTYEERSREEPRILGSNGSANGNEGMVENREVAYLDNSEVEEESNQKRKRDSQQHQGYNDCKRMRGYSRLPNAIPRPVVCKQETLVDCNPPSLRDDEKGFIRLVDPFKLMQETSQPPPPSLSYEQKRQLGIERAKLVLAQIQLESTKAQRHEFLMVNTIAKLPVSSSYMLQGGYENPSPLQNNFNVVYKFNSISGSEINIGKWGLEPLPGETSKLLNLLGIDVDSLKEIEANTATPQHVLRMRKDATENGEVTIKTENLLPSTVGLYKSIATQTSNQSWSQDMETQTKPIKESLEKRTFWQDPQFDTMRLTQTQINIMFGLQELTKIMPHSFWAEKFYNALQSALNIKRSVLKDPRLTKTMTN